ncbi:hypothetical protein [Erythrobacter donghaensis]|uniref:hypothetical protein n=1 Tax=Erythrobacter donghaensis TaxID=267135 RepID=UPI0012D91909|nr:hypothetical protein [Erythrobacter donghaensis]
MRAALQHFARHGDVTQVQQLLELVTDREVRFVIARRVATQFPIRVNQSGKLSRDKDRSPDFDWSAIETASFWPRRIQSEAGHISIRNEEFSLSELIDEVIDVLVLHRHTIPDGDLERLQNAVDTVAKRRRPRAPSEPGLPASPKERM